MPVFNFGELIPNGHVTVFDGRMVAVETAMLVTGKDRNTAGAALRNIPEGQFSSTKFVEKRLPGKGSLHDENFVPHDEIVTLCHNLHIPANHLVVRDKGRTH